ncbi:MAG: ATP-dependent zinc metalloprotease FtsH, partial [Oscillospiraceae bacterium]|nr:ATP-dependent zinc metalloprotease FtsH [Oscillospiraceae bacterium]
MTPKRSRGFLAYLTVALVLVFLAVFWLPRINEKKSEYTYSEIMKHFDDLEVTEYTLDLGSGELKLTLEDETEIEYTVPNVTIFKEETEGYRLRYNEAHPDAPLDQDYYRITDNSWLITYIPTFIILIMGIVLFIFMMRQAGGGKYNNFGRANIKAQPSNKKATFADVAGADEEKFEMAEVVDFLKNPRKYTEVGARIPKGVLLLGPPGTGKTLLARAVAGEAGCPFYPISGSDFVEMFVGVGASRVRDLFETAKKNAPSIIFIDEIDAVGRHRGAGLGGGHDEREQTLNQLLVEMDGFEGNESVIVIAATNRRDILDPALLRPGRFDRQIVVGYPDIKGREDILKVHTKNKPLAPDVNLSDIAKTTVGFTGADLENLCNEAALLAARNDRKAITNRDIAEATIKVVAGPEKKSRVKTEREIKLTAYHEAGHAICTYYCPHQDKVHEISIVPRGMAGGYTLSLPEHDKSYNSKMEMHEEIIVLLGGRVAEKLIMDDISTGASNDLERATGMARRMITKYGFSEKLGPVVYGNNESEPFLGRDFSSTPNYSDEVAAEIDAEIRAFVEEGYDKAEDILRTHMDQLHRVAQYLIKHEKVDGPGFEVLMTGGTLPDEADDCVGLAVAAQHDAAHVGGAVAVVGNGDGNDRLVHGCKPSTPVGL